MSARQRLLKTLADPNVAYILMLLGIYGLFFELSNPGALVPGILGGICLLLALFAFQALPVNYAGRGADPAGGGAADPGGQGDQLRWADHRRDRVPGAGLAPALRLGRSRGPG